MLETNQNMSLSNNILLVEDDFDFLWLIQKILKMNGFNVLTAATTDKAVELFSRNIFNINAVILDISLPNKEGILLWMEFRKIAPNIPIIITTSSENRPQRNKLEKLGIRGYIVKPFEIMNLVSVMSKII
jgi:DNA-binding response OmpR family regulator